MKTDHVSSDVQTVAIMAAILYGCGITDDKGQQFTTRGAVHTAHMLFAEAVSYAKENAPKTKGGSE